MKITPESLARIGGAKFTAESVTKVFGFMEAQCNELGANNTAFSFDFQKPEDVVGHDSLIPVLTLSLRPATPNPPNADATVDLRAIPDPVKPPV